MSYSVLLPMMFEFDGFVKLPSSFPVVGTIELSLKRNIWSTFSGQCEVNTGE